MKQPSSPDDDKEDLPRRLKSAFAVVLSLAVLIGAGTFAIVWLNDTWYAIRTVEDYIGEGEEDVQVTIPAGTSLGGIGTILVKADVVKTTRAFSQAVNDNPDSSGIQAGKYNLKTQISAEQAVEMLLDPDNLVRTKMTLPEGLTVKQSVQVMAKAAGLKETTIRTGFEDLKEVGLPAWAASKSNVEGFLFPETYELPQNATGDQVVSLTTEQFTKITTSIDFENRSKQRNVTPYRALIIASLIEAEVHDPDYQAQVSRVIYNRLAKGMELALDSTVHYAVGKTGSVTTTDEERQTQSPYNTYLNTGLTPTPINSPGQSAMEAAVTPADGDWLYFVTVDLDTGETLFATTYSEHQANVKKFQEWCNDHSGRC